MTSGQYLSRGIDYLGDLGAKLRDLRGFTTLAHELIQNADDASQASSISFDVRQDAFIVDNNGVFSDCGRIEEPECPWKDEPQRGYRCDFHRFRRVASGDKREQAGTIGAFGIGFIAVYQITDRPELISAGRHWILQEDRPEAERIKVCPGCNICQDPELPPTRFILPWAYNPNSDLRKKLRAEAVTDKDLPALLQELERSLPTAMLFLKKLNSIDVKRDGCILRSIERIAEGDELIVNDGTSDHIWHLLRGNFSRVAEELREQQIGRIEEKRSADVTLAIPDVPLETGLFCAFLPTQHETGLPFHINADFFPTSDRKRIIFESEYQSEWNRAAIRATAETLRDHLDRLPTLLDHRRLWEIIGLVHQASQNAKESTIGCFWEFLKPALSRSRVFFTTRAEWRTRSEVLLLGSEEEESAVTLLEGLGISLVHSDLRPHFTLLRRAEVGVQLLDVSHVVKSLQECGLTKRTKLSDLPNVLRTEASLRVLWRELGLLLRRYRKPEEQEKAKQELSTCAIALGRNGALWPCQEVYQAEEETVTLFARITPHIPFLAELGEEGEGIKGLCPKFLAASAIQQLTHLSKAELEKAWKEGRLDPACLLRWFESQREEILRSVDLKHALIRLPIFPSSSALEPLSELLLPGNFTDPIGLTDLVDLNCLGGRREFLRDLGAKELTFQRYAADYIPSAFIKAGVASEKKRKAVRLLADELGKIRDDPTVHQSLMTAPIVECEDGSYRKPAEVYFRSTTVAEILGNEVHFAVVPREGEEATREFYRWLGVTEKPRYKDIVERVKRLMVSPPDHGLLQSIQAIFRHLGDRLRESNQKSEVLSELRLIAWLPARGDRSRWYRSQDLYAVFRDYLFESQAQFLDLPREVQSSAGELLDFLKIEIEPPVSKVVAHLLKRSETGGDVNKEVYRFLNDKAQDPAVMQLKGKACLRLPDGTYVRPDQVFWGEHPFGRFRRHLGPDLRRYGDLFHRLGVREAPNHGDALQVMIEIADEYGAANLPLDDATYGVLMACWQMLNRAVETSEIGEGDLRKLSGRKVIPNVHRILYPPEWMFFEDRAGLVDKFGPSLQNNMIPRPQGVWRAMTMAGVQTLGSAVRSHLIECADPANHGLVSRRVQERRLQIARVLESQVRGADPTLNLSILDQLRCQSVRRLKINFSLCAFNREFPPSNPENVPAYFQRDKASLYFVCRNGQPPWPSIAREFALALCPDEEPGRLASGIKEVLVAESEEEARSALDELGFSPLEMAPPSGTPDGNCVDDLGGESAPSDVEQVEVLGESNPDQQDRDEQLSGREEEVRQVSGPARPGISLAGGGAVPLKPATEKENAREIPVGVEKAALPSGDEPPDSESEIKGGSCFPSKRDPIKGGDWNETDGKTSPPPGNGGGETSLKGRSHSSSPGPGVDHFGLFVTRQNTGERETDNSGYGGSRDDDETRRVVVEYEKHRGRCAQEMPRNQPGYDILSEDPLTGRRRLIEVKGEKGRFEESASIVLTKTQFEDALLNLDKDTEYWLYVVDSTETSRPRVFPIPWTRYRQELRYGFYACGWVSEAEQPATVTPDGLKELELSALSPLDPGDLKNGWEDLDDSGEE